MIRAPASEGNCMAITSSATSSLARSSPSRSAFPVGARANRGSSFSLDWKYEGTQAPFLLALDRGYYKAEGLDVTIDTAGGSASRSTASRRALRHGVRRHQLADQVPRPEPADAAQGDLHDLQQPPFAIVTRRAARRHAKDLEGKKLGAPAADAPTRSGRSS